jgi:acetyltransferase-like isoleucine patch superfamily enzyme
VVTKDVEADTLVVGVPARPIKKIDSKKDKE